MSVDLLPDIILCEMTSLSFTTFHFCSESLENISRRILFIIPEFIFVMII